MLTFGLTRNLRRDAGRKKERKEANDGEKEEKEDCEIGLWKWRKSGDRRREERGSKGDGKREKKRKQCRKKER